MQVRLAGLIGDVGEAGATSWEGEGLVWGAPSHNSATVRMTKRAGDTRERIQFVGGGNTGFNDLAGYSRPYLAGANVADWVFATVVAPGAPPQGYSPRGGGVRT